MSSMDRKKIKKQTVAPGYKQLRIVDARQYDFNRVPQTVSSMILGISITALAKWFQLGAPKNDDKSCSIRDLVSWKIDHELGKVRRVTGDSQNVKTQIDEKKLEKLEIELQQLRSAVIPQEKARQLFETQVLKLKDFITQSVEINLSVFMARLKLDKHQQELFIELMRTFAEDMINSFVEADNGEDFEF